MRIFTHKRLRRRGFTLIEILVVVAILGILAAAVIPKIVGRSDDAKVARAHSDISSLVTQLEAFYLDMGNYPTGEDGLMALLTEPSEGDETVESGGTWKGPYLQKKPVDPWGREYIYESPGTVNEDSFDLLSYGRDGQEGGEGFDADIKHWTSEGDEGEEGGEVEV